MDASTLISQIARMTPYPDADSDPESTLNFLITQARGIAPTAEREPAGVILNRLRTITHEQRV
jgi:hypothetical protein